MSVKVKPLGDRILVQRVEAKKQTDSGIYLPDAAQEKPQQAKVIAVGDGNVNENTGKRVKPDVKKGDTILLSKWGGTEVKLGDDELLIINTDDVLAVFE